jgi:hypothetical protein
MSYDDWRTTDPGAEFLGDAEQEEDLCYEDDQGEAEGGFLPSF